MSSTLILPDHNNRATLFKRPPFLLAPLMCAALALTACGKDNENESARESGDDSSHFPVTLETGYGEVTIDEDPETVVLTDIIPLPSFLDLGISPDIVDKPGGRDISESMPYIDGVFTGEIDDSITSDSTGQVDVESVANQDPDIIVTRMWNTDESTYDRLSDIAPTVVIPDNLDWEENIRFIANIFGKNAEHEQILEDREDLFDKLRSEIPDLQGKSFDQVWGQPDSFYYADTVGRTLTSMGLVEAPGRAEAEEDHGVAPAVSLENISNLDADVLVFGSGGSTEGFDRELEKNASFKELPSYKNDAVLYVDWRHATAGNGLIGIEWIVEDFIEFFKNTQYSEE